MASRVKTRNLEIDDLGITDTIEFLHDDSGNNAIRIRDNQAVALSIEEGSDSYITFNTTNNSEQIVFGQDSTFAATTIADLGSVTTADINGGTIDNTVIGGATPMGGTFTVLKAEDQLVVEAGASITGDTANETTLAVKGVGSQTADLMTVKISNNTDKFRITSDGSVIIAENLTLATGSTVSSIRNEDNMSSNSATSLATQASIKAYVDNEIAGLGGGASEMNGLNDVSVSTTTGSYTINDLNNLIFNGGARRLESFTSGAISLNAGSATSISKLIYSSGNLTRNIINSKTVKSFMVKANINLYAIINSTTEFYRSYVISASFVPFFDTSTPFEINALEMKGDPNNFSTGDSSTNIFTDDIDLAVDVNKDVVLQATTKDTLAGTSNLYLDGLIEIIITAV